MSQKPSDSLFSVKSPNHLCTLRSSSVKCMWLFLTCMELSNTNLFCSDKLYTNNAKEADVYRKNCNKKDTEGGRHTGDWFIHCNNAPPLYVQKFMANDSLTVGLDPPSSPNLTTCNNFFSDTQNGNEPKKIPESSQLYSSKHRMSTDASNSNAAYGHTVPRCKKTTLKGTVWNRRQM